MIAVRRFAAGDAAAAAAIIRGLPDHFTGDVPEKVERDAVSHEAWVVTEFGAVAGFVLAARKSPGGAEILWIAVDAARRGRRHGTRLLGHILDHLATAGVSVVEAKTLDRLSGYHPYEATRAFWERNGVYPGRHDRPPARLAARQPGNNLCGRHPPDSMTTTPPKRNPQHRSRHEMDTPRPHLALTPGVTALSSVRCSCGEMTRPTALVLTSPRAWAHRNDRHSCAEGSRR